MTVFQPNLPSHQVSLTKEVSTVSVMGKRSKIVIKSESGFAFKLLSQCPTRILETPHGLCSKLHHKEIS